ncbi:MAG: transposase [Proteobacteria bacterium]|nr:transposase [Pseudomonadota bacterium]
MTAEQKVKLVKTVKDTYGLNLALAAIDLAKSTWYYHQKHKVAYEEKYADLFPILEEIARNHPEYGVPRIMPELRDEYHIDVNHKVVERLLGMWDLSILRSTRRPRPSRVQKVITEAGELANLVVQMDEIGLFQVVYTDFTEILYADGDRKAILMPIIGHVSKMAFGWAIGQSRGKVMALQAWQYAKKTFQQMDISYVGMIMHHDRDSVYTSPVLVVQDKCYEWTSQLLLKDKSRLSYALRGAKDNPEMESFNGRFKTEGHSLFLEARTLGELITVVDERIRYYNTERRHSSIGYVPPLMYIKHSWSKGEE